MLGTVDAVPTPSVFTAATSTVTVPAGSMHVTAIDGGSVNPATHLLAINMSGVTFSGGQFYLYLSKDGLASQSTGDVKYSPVFDVSAFGANVGTLGTVSNVNGTFYIGTFGSSELVVGPIPIDVSSSYKFIKVYDGSTGAEAVTTQQLIITPGITLTPTSGPALTQVVVNGGGFAEGQTVNINYTFPFYFFNNGTLKNMHGVLFSGIGTGLGWFTSASTPIVDSKQAYNPVSGGDKPTTPISLFAVNASDVSSTLSNTVTFTETNRFFSQVESWTPDWYTTVYSSGISTFGNDTGAAPILPTQPIKVYVFSHVIIAGNFSASSALTFQIGATILSSTDNFTTSTGFFNTTVKIPILASGVYTLVALNNGVKYTFSIHVYPTMILTNSSGAPVSFGTASNPSTTVYITVYGFPALTTEYIYWNSTSVNLSWEYNKVNITTTANGEINSSMPHSFVVPESYGGPHNVTAFTVFHGASFANSNYNTYYTENGNGTATFTVLPSLVVLPGSFNSTYGLPVVAVGEGLTPGVFYSVNIDNQQADFALVNTANQTVITHCYYHHFFFFGGCTYGTNTTLAWTEGAVTPNGYGVLNLTFIGAGFNPGLHVLSLTSDQEYVNAGNYEPASFALFTVTPIGNWEYNMLNSINASISGFSSSISTLSTNVHGWINDAVTSINAHTDSEITSLSSSIQDMINTAVTSINAHTDSEITSLSSSITSAIASINSHTDSAVGGLASSATATNISNAVNTEQTYVLVVAVLAAIILVLVLAVLIRKLS